jgi:hypothetical protein
VIAVAIITKATSFALLPGFLLVVAVGLWRARRPLSLRRVAGPLVAGAIPLLAIGGTWFAIAHSLHRPAAAQISGAARAGDIDWLDFAGYLWQYYLPALPGMHRFPFSPSGYPLFQVWMKTAWAAFGWLEVRFPVNVYRALSLITTAVFAGGALALWRARRGVDLAVVAFLAVAVVAQLAGLHWTDYHFLRDGNAFMQGRYLFPILPVAAIALAGAVSLLRDGSRHFAAGAAIGGLFAFHVACVGLVVARFYA